VSTFAPIALATYETRVADAITGLLVDAFPPGLRAVVLTGSLARGEGTWLQEGARIRLAGDADVFIIFNDRAALPPPEHIARIERAAGDRLAAGGIDAHLGMSPVRAGYLRGLRPEIFSYELITHGKVIYGDPEILKLVPAFTASQIPLDDGFRLLMNRMIELLATICEPDALPMRASAVQYAAIKLWLDMATSYLLFEHQYVPTYCGRAERLRALGAEPSAFGPIPLRRFAKTVALATRRKLGDSWGPETQDISDLETLINDAHSLWRWELARLIVPGASDADLLERWIAAEPISARMRGWAAIAKRAGTLRALSRFPTWIGLARKGSPRRLIYAAASELIFALPRLVEEEVVLRSDSRWIILRHGLPVTDSSRDQPSRCAWRRLGQAIAYNYNFFLASTRS